MPSETKTHPRLKLCLGGPDNFPAFHNQYLTFRIGPNCPMLPECQV
jgi:hypothetical protein